jgi:hypothetical protein
MRPRDTAERISSVNLLSLKSGQTMQAPQALTTIERQQVRGNFPAVQLTVMSIQLQRYGPNFFVVVLRVHIKK